MKQNSIFKSVQIITLVLAFAMLFSFANATKVFTGLPWGAVYLTDWTKVDFASGDAYGDPRDGGGALTYPIVVKQEEVGISHVWSTYYLNTDTYNPAVDGAINSIDAQYYVGVLTNWGINTGYLGVVVQNGKTYYAPTSQHLTSVEWPLVTLNKKEGMVANDYVEILAYGSVDANSHPDFSATGAALNVGFMMEDYAAGLTARLGIPADLYPGYEFSYPYMRDFKVTVNSGIPVYTLSVTSNPVAKHITISPADNNGKTSAYAPEERAYYENTTVTLTADTVAGWDFVRWTGYPDGQNTITVSMTSHKSVNAEYTLSASLSTKEYTETDWVSSEGADGQPDNWNVITLTDFEEECPEWTPVASLHSRVDYEDEILEKNSVVRTFTSSGYSCSNGTHYGGYVFGSYYKTTFVHDPAVDGPVAKLDFYQETNGPQGWWDGVLWGLQVGMFSLVQDGKTYVARADAYGKTSYELTHRESPFLHSNLTPQESNDWHSSAMFVLWDGAYPNFQDLNQHPDFSASGAPIYFGFVRGNFDTWDTSNLTDNYKVKVYYVPQNTTITGTVVDSNTSSVNCDAQLVGRSYTWKVLSTGENGVGTVGTGGAISFVVTSAGTSDICIKIDGSLSVKAEGVTLSGTVDVGSLSVTLPDILNDDVLDDFDLNEINGGFGNTVYPGSGADYNCDGLYDDFDLNQINGSFGTTGACYGL